jgi:type IV pilus assembly protein PilW
MTPSRTRQQGLSLVELMIAIALGLVITAGLTYTFIAGRQSYRMQDNLSRIQENARVALDSMAQDLRMAGFIGCAGLGAASPYVTPAVRANTPPVASFTLANALAGFESGTGWTNSTGITQVAGSDVLTLQRGSGGGAYLSGAMASNSAAIAIGSNPDGFATNDVLLISDCSSADIFRASQVSGTTINHANSHNSSNSVSKAYGVNARVMGYQSSTYFIGTSATGAPTLYRQPWAGSAMGTAEELAEYVEDMQLTYGVDTDGDNTVNQYVTAADINADAAAAPNWDQVKTIRIRLLVGSPEDSVTDTANTHATLSGTATDRRLHRTFSMTVSLRNRLP